MIKGIEGRRTWVSDRMLTNLSRVLGVSAFQLLVPSGGAATSGDSALIASLLSNLKQNIQDDINGRFDRLIQGNTGKWREKRFHTKKQLSPSG